MPDIVINIEVSLRRNYQDLRFCPQDNAEDLRESRRRSLSVLQTNYPKGQVLGNALEYASELSYLQGALLPADYYKINHAALFYDRHTDVIAAINMDDHLVLKAQGGLEQLDHLQQVVREAEQAMAQAGLVFAQDADFGYLSYRPTMSGSGLFINAILHLPMLHYLKQIRSLGEMLKTQEYLLRPLAVHDKRNPAKMYVLSNATSLNRGDGVLVQRIREFVDLLSQREALLREKALTRNGQSAFADQVWRSYGILRFARRLNDGDFLNHWSNLRLGSLAGILPLSIETVDSLLVYSGNQVFLKEGADTKNIVGLRAQNVRQALSGG